MWAAMVLGVGPALLICASFFVPAIRQNSEYHQFADQRTIFGIANFWNVVSNAAFLIAAAVGASTLRNAPHRAASVILTLGTVGVAFGSAYYHFAPDSSTLFWDRLPMTIVFMAIFAITLEERIDPELGRWSLGPLVAIGVASVVFWRASGDLRFYGAVQFYPMLAIPLLLIFRPGSRVALAGLVVFYAAAKLLEIFDSHLGAWVATGGHPWKHLAGAAGLVWFFVRSGAVEESRHECRLAA